MSLPLSTPEIGRTVEVPPGYRVCGPKRPRTKGKKGRTVYCWKVKPEYKDGKAQFKVSTSNKNGKIYMSNQCNECAKETNRRSYRARKKSTIKRVKRWKRDNPERVAQYREAERLKQRERDRIRQQDPEWRAKNQARMRDYYQRNKEAEKARTKEYKRKKRIEFQADLPLEVIVPFLQEAVQVFGHSAYARLVGFNEKRLRTLLEGGPGTAVSVALADKLAMASGGRFTLEELHDRTKEWAFLTGMPWPEAYAPNLRAYRRRLIKKAMAGRQQPSEDSLAQAA